MNWRRVFIRSINWKVLAEPAGILAILLGLFFVFEELQLIRTVARAELSAESARMFSVLDAQERDPAFARVLVKSRNNSNELTPSEQVQLNSYFHSAVMVYIRELYNYRRGIFEEFASLIGPTAPRYFGSGYGRAYWNYNKHVYPVQIANAVDDALTNNERISFFDQRDSAILEELQQQ